MYLRILEFPENSGEGDQRIRDLLPESSPMIDDHPCEVKISMCFGSSILDLIT